MSFLLDTNVLSELRKGRRCSPMVAMWAGSVPNDRFFTSVLVIGEVRRGIQRLLARDPDQAQRLGLWLEQVRRAFAGRVLSVDERVADAWGRLGVRRPMPVIDGLLAATALVHDLTLVTRNVRDVASAGVPLLDPFQQQS